VKVERERVLRDVTFWLRPDFVVRCLRRFQKLEGFDRAVALASLTFCAIVPLGIVTSGVLQDRDAGAQLVDRFGLEGEGARAVNELFSRGDDITSGFSLFSIFLLIVTILSFSRALQRLFERTWELQPLSVRNTKNGLVWVAGLVVYSTVAGFVRTSFDSGVMEVVTAALLCALGLAFVIWTGTVLTNGRVTRNQLLPAGILVVALGVILGIGGDIYVPRLFNSYASRYGAVGSVFAMISWLFVVMVALVAAVAVGREVWAELQAIRRGDRPSNEQIEAEWAQVRAQMDEGRTQVAERTRAARERFASWRAHRRG
jgi:membrane protein